MDVTVAVGTFGDPAWVQLAHERAIPSAETLGVPVVHRHGRTLASGRNEALALVETPNVVFLDADDELEPGFIATLAAGSAHLRVPAVRYVRGSMEHAAYIPRVPGHEHDCTGDCLPDGNFMVIGTWAPTELLVRVGGFEEWPVYEDWALWLRCWRAGATIERIPNAVYRAHVNLRSRNRAPAMAEKNRAHGDIVSAVIPELARAA